MRKSAIDTLEELRSADSEESLRDSIERYLSNTDISTYAYISFNLFDGPKCMNNHPHFWLEHYAENGYLDIDPVISRARNKLLPFQWQELSPTLNKAEQKVLNEGSEVGIASGASIPVPGPGNNSGMFFFSSHVSDQQFDKHWEEFKHELHLIGLYFHAAFIELSKNNVEQPYACNLTTREKECLLWTAKGKTAWEISRIINTSERTAVFHLQNAAKKLNCTSKHQAVVRAIMLDLISP